MRSTQKKVEGLEPLLNMPPNHETGLIMSPTIDPDWFIIINKWRETTFKSFLPLL